MAQLHTSDKSYIDFKIIWKKTIELDKTRINWMLVRDELNKVI